MKATFNSPGVHWGVGKRWVRDWKKMETQKTERSASGVEKIGTSAEE